MRLLMVLPRFPYPLEKGDKLRAYHLLRYLSQKHEVSLFCVSDCDVSSQDMEEVLPYCKQIVTVNLTRWGRVLNMFCALCKGLPLQVGYFYSQKAVRELHKLAEEFDPQVVFTQLIRMSEYTKRMQCRRVLDYQDAMSKNVERRMRKGSWYMRPLLKLEAGLVRRYEKQIFPHFDAHTIISAEDRELLPIEQTLPISVVPNGVDVEFFSPQDVSKKYEVIFSGNMGYPPNIDAARFLVKDIMPIVWQTHPQCKVLLLGANPHPSVETLANHPLVTVTGWVEDMRPYYASSQIYVAPMRIGSGLQNKLLEAMAMELPCITSLLANQALLAKEGEEVLIGDGAQMYASLIVDLLMHPQKRINLAKKGRLYMTENYQWDKIAEKMSRILEGS